MIVCMHEEWGRWPPMSEQRELIDPKGPWYTAWPHSMKPIEAAISVQYFRDTNAAVLLDALFD